MAWVYEVQIERLEAKGKEIKTEQYFVLADKIEDVIHGFEIDSLDENCEVTMIKRLVPICRNITINKKE